MNTRYRLMVQDEDQPRAIRTEKDDAIAQAHEIADLEHVNVAVVTETFSLLVFVRPSHAHPAPISHGGQSEPRTASDAVRAAFDEGLRLGLASAKSLAQMTVEELCEFRWRESEAFDYHRALTAIEGEQP